MSDGDINRLFGHAMRQHFHITFEQLERQSNCRLKASNVSIGSLIERTPKFATRWVTEAILNI